jgi:hypothetical protein
MHIIIIFCVVAFIVWIVWKVRARKRAALDRAWDEALSDPNLMDRFPELKRKLTPPPSTDEEWRVYDQNYKPSTDEEWEAYDRRYDERKQKRADKARANREAG